MISDFYWPFLGGVEQHVRTLSHALQRRGHDVAVATLWREGLAAQEDDAGVQVHRLRSSTQRLGTLYSTPQRTWAPPVPDPEVTVGLRRVLRACSPQIVHGHDWLARSYLPLKPFRRAPLIMSLHYYTLSCAKKNLMRDGAPCSGPAPDKCLRCSAHHYGAIKGMGVAASNWLMGAAERRGVDRYIAVSHATALGNGLANGATTVIPNFLPAQQHALAADLKPYLDQLPAGDFFLFVGDLRPMKGVDVLLAAYRTLDNPPPLVLIGKVWPDTPQSFPPNVHILRDWPNAAVMAAWQRSAVAVVPSIWAEPFGIVVIEAMAGATPVVASCVGGIPEIVEDGVSGILVPSGDTGALAQALARLTHDVPLRRRMGEAARHRATDYDAAVVVPQIEALYQQVLDA